MKNYFRVFAAIYVLCSNWLRIFLHKLLGLPLSEVKLNNGINFFTINRKLGKADLSMFSEIWFYEYYNPPFFSIKENDIVFDVGANNGYFSVYAALKAKVGKVYALEPVPALADLIQKNSVENLLRNIEVERLALAGKSGEGEFYLSKRHNGCHSLYKRAPDDEPISVKLISLADFCRQKQISAVNFLKMDCEGAEYDILLNLDPSVLDIIEKISMEYHDDIVGHNHGEIADFLRKHNFMVAEKSGYLYALNKSRIH